MVQAARVCAEGSKAGFRFVLAADLRLRAQKHVAPDKEIDGGATQRRSNGGRLGWRNILLSRGGEII
jgi:hypothetical protein